MFVYKLSGCGFESHCSHLNLRYCTCFNQGVPWHSGNNRTWIHCEMHTWHDKNIHSNAWQRYILKTQLNHLASLAKLLGACFWTKRLWVRLPLQSLKLEISQLLWARSIVQTPPPFFKQGGLTLPKIPRKWGMEKLLKGCCYSEYFF